MRIEQVVEEYDLQDKAFKEYWGGLEGEGTPHSLLGQKRAEEQRRLEVLIRDQSLAFMEAVLLPLREQYLSTALTASEPKDIYEARGAYMAFEDVVNYLLNLCADED
jgi:hypothetical protein